MPPSQLKRLKSSLREQGVTGPQKSKKQKKAAPSSRHADRNAALQQIRDSFNPFELKPSRPAKFESVSHKTANAAKNGGRYKEVLHRPGVTKSAGEEMRRRQLLPEMQRRNKMGGLVDRRIGENDATMTPEERAVQRFAREKGRKKGRSMFDLEASDEEEGGAGLTHLGRKLDELDGEDFVDSVAGSEEDDQDGEELMRRKRPREEDMEDDVDDASKVVGQQPERKKTKKEVMEEVIAKSKLHKYERQKAKEDDDDLREELDNGMADMLALLQGRKPPPPEISQSAEAVVNEQGPTMNPDRQRLLDGMDRQKADKEYEVRLKQLAQDTRAQPSERTKTEEEKFKDEAERLRKMEEMRAKRMRGESVSEDDEDSGDRPAANVGEVIALDDDVPDEAAEFGFTSFLAQPKIDEEVKVLHDDEDEFTFDDDLLASGSDVELSDDSGSSDGSEGEADAAVAHEHEEEDEFVKGILGDAHGAVTATIGGHKPPGSTGLAYTYPCPRSHIELLDVFRDVTVSNVPTVVQRIRALHHPSLSAANKEAMAEFTAALVDHISYMGTEKQPFPVVEQLIRHLHSLSRTYPTEIAEAFRKRLQGFHERGQPTAGDLMILTAIGSIYPTSDHFHQVVTPAITLMARWLGINDPADSEDKRTMGAFLVALCLRYQKLSQRVVPEAIRFTLRALASKPGPQVDVEKMRPHIDNLVTMADLWKHKSAFVEIFSPAVPLLHKLSARREHQYLQILLQQARLRRRPLELHHHRLQPIRTSIPKFEEGFNPDKHYDPDKDRSDARKLQKEYKRERKGAVRELRKDANFIAREQLREKRERDAEYERKQRRLIAEIQGEEGHEAKSYEREKAARKRAR